MFSARDNYQSKFSCILQYMDHSVRSNRDVCLEHVNSFFPGGRFESCSWAPHRCWLRMSKYCKGITYGLITSFSVCCRIGIQILGSTGIVGINLL
jgi:hypothetical protein